MTVASTALSGVTPFGGRVAPRGTSRRVARGVALGAATIGTACVLGATATMTAVWLVATARPDNLSSHSISARGPGAMALAQFSAPPGNGMDRPSPLQVSAAAGAMTFDSKWALAAIPEEQSRDQALTIKSRTGRTKVAALAPASVAVVPPAKALSDVAKRVPLPRARPAIHDVARAAPVAPAPVTAPAPKPVIAAPQTKIATAPPVEKPATTASHQKIAAAAPPEKPAPATPPQKAAAVAPAEKPMAPAHKLAMVASADTTGSIPRETPSAPRRELSQPVLNKVTLPAPGSRFAVYDISASTVYLPSGEKLEAHSGLGDKMDDPRHVNVRMRGATPPNIYNLAMRESLFHGVAAIRLKPVHEDRMFGRDGILAHTYMLGSNGQSNGCVSFKNYAAFLRAFQKGEFDRMIVVAKMGDPMPDLDSLPAVVRTARATPTTGSTRRWRVADSLSARPSRQMTDQW
jgi:hypothetical protein